MKNNFSETNVISECGDIAFYNFVGQRVKWTWLVAHMCPCLHSVVLQCVVEVREENPVHLR